MAAIILSAPQTAPYAAVRSVDSHTTWNVPKGPQTNTPNKINCTIIDEQADITKRLQNNLKKLEEISNFSQNWNGYGAQPFNPDLLKKAKDLILSLKIQPELFPTADGSIQIEWEKVNGEYLEIQITLNDTLPVFRIDSKDNEFNSTVSTNSTAVNDIVDQFYEQSL